MSFQHEGVPSDAQLLTCNNGKNIGRKYFCVKNDDGTFKYFRWADIVDPELYSWVIAHELGDAAFFTFCNKELTNIVHSVERLQVILAEKIKCTIDQNKQKEN